MNIGSREPNFPSRYDICEGRFHVFLHEYETGRCQCGRYESTFPFGIDRADLDRLIATKGYGKKEPA